MSSADFNIFEVEELSSGTSVEMSLRSVLISLVTQSRSIDAELFLLCCRRVLRL